MRITPRSFCIKILACFRLIFSASQLWKAEYTDEGVCSLALINAEYALGEEDLELQSGLLFAGHYNGQISLLDGHGKQFWA